MWVCMKSSYHSRPEFVVQHFSQQSSSKPYVAWEIQEIAKGGGTKSPLGTMSRRLNDLLSTSFGTHIINYEPSRGFVVPKFTMCDGMSGPL